MDGVRRVAAWWHPALRRIPRGLRRPRLEPAAPWRSPERASSRCGSARGLDQMASLRRAASRIDCGSGPTVTSCTRRAGQRCRERRRPTPRAEHYLSSRNIAGARGLQTILFGGTPRGDITSAHYLLGRSPGHGPQTAPKELGDVMRLLSPGWGSKTWRKAVAAASDPLLRAREVAGRLVRESKEYRRSFCRLRRQEAA